MSRVGRFRGSTDSPKCFDYALVEFVEEVAQATLTATLTQQFGWTLEAALLAIVVAIGEAFEDRLDGSLALADEPFGFSRGIEAQPFSFLREGLSLGCSLGHETDEMPGFARGVRNTNRNALDVEAMVVVASALLQAVSTLGLIVGVAHEHDHMGSAKFGYQRKRSACGPCVGGRRATFKATMHDNMMLLAHLRHIFPNEDGLPSTEVVEIVVPHPINAGTKSTVYQGLNGSCICVRLDNQSDGWR